MSNPLHKIALPTGLTAKDVAVLRLELTEDWTVADLASLLHDLDIAYSAFSTRFTFLTDRIDDESFMHAFERESLHAGGKWLITAFGMRFYESSIALTVNRIQMASPGIVEIIGSLNPLKLILDFITAWRQENTQRRRAEFERDHAVFLARMEAWKVLMEKADKLSKRRQDWVYSRFMGETLHTSQLYLRKVGDERRIQKAELDPVVSIKKTRITKK